MADLRASNSSSSLRARSASAWSNSRWRSRRPRASCARRSASCLWDEGTLWACGTLGGHWGPTGDTGRMQTGQWEDSWRHVEVTGAQDTGDAVGTLGF